MSYAGDNGTCMTGLTERTAEIACAPSFPCLSHRRRGSGLPNAAIVDEHLLAARVSRRATAMEKVLHSLSGYRSAT